jgi:cell division protein FtsL
MSNTDKIKAIGTSNRSVVLIVALAVMALALLCMLPLYMQNRINSLYEESHGLQVEIAFLKHDALALELRINQLSSLEKLSKFADSVGLGLNGLPQKVMPIGGSR